MGTESREVSVAWCPTQTAGPQSPPSPTHHQPSSHPGCQPSPGQEENSRRNLHCLEIAYWPLPLWGT